MLILFRYSRIADSLARFEILSDAFVANADFQQTLAVFYADILQFHKYAYKFVRRTGELHNIILFLLGLNTIPVIIQEAIPGLPSSCLKH